MFVSFDDTFGTPCIMRRAGHTNLDLEEKQLLSPLILVMIHMSLLKGYNVEIGL